MEIKMTATVNDEGNDVFRLLDGDGIDVEVTGNKGVEQLKQLFNRLLNLMLVEEVTVEFEPTTGYGNKMYEDVCREYVGVLETELVKAREKLVAEGLCR